MFSFSSLRTAFAATFGGSFLFMGLVAFCILLAQYNANLTPGIPWFPIVILPVVFGLAYWSDRRWDTALAAPVQPPTGLIIAFAVVSNLAAQCVGVLERASKDVVDAFPAGPEGASPLFLVCYWVFVSIALSTASEFCFRGIMQSVLERIWGLWPAVLLVVLFNTFAHPWDTLWLRFFSVLAVLFAWGWLRYLGGSLKLCILVHLVVVMGRDVPYWFTGPVDYSEFTDTALMVAGASGLALLGASWWLSREILSRRAAASPAALEGTA